jgi:hydrophobic/amphiphilic exporter-1 (mainly G- bacteria), HAE1 family
MSWLTRVSLRNRSVVALIVVAIIIVGVFAVGRLRQELMPNIEFPALTIFTMEPGASPADVERAVTTPLEGAIKGSPGLKQLDSYSNEGMSIIVAQYEYGTDMPKVKTDVQSAVGRVQPYLPTGTAPQVATINFGDVPVVQLAVTSSTSPAELAALLQAKAVPKLQQIPGVAAVSLSGLQGSRVDVALQPAALAQYGIAPTAIVSALTSANVSIPAGTVVSDGTVVPVRVTSEAVGIEALSALPVGTAGGSAVIAGAGAAGTHTAVAHGPIVASQSSTTATAAPTQVTLGQVAKLTVVPTPATSLTRTNGQPSIGIALTKSGSGNVVQISNDMRALLPGLQKDLGGAATITIVNDQAPYIQSSISGMWRDGLLGAVFAILVILIFLRSWRSTVVAGVSIPLSVIVALILLYSRDMSLNVLTLGGLTIAIGRVIDDSIVVLENAYRHLQEGDDVMDAAYKGAREVSSAVTASTLTTVAVFLPLGFVQGIAAVFFRPFALTVTFALLASLLVSLTVVPVGVSWLLSKKSVGHREKDETTLLQRMYLPALKLAISHRLITIILAIAVFVGAMSLTPLLKTNLVDSSGNQSFTLNQQLPPGTALSVTSDAAKKVEAVLAKTPGVTTYQVTIGSTGDLFGPGGGTNASSSRAAFTILADTIANQPAVMEAVRSATAGLKDAGDITVAGADTMGTGSAIEVRIYADDPAVLQQANDLVLQRVRGVGGMANVTSNLSQSVAQISIKVDPTKAAAAGVDATQVGQFMGLALRGTPIGNVLTDQGPLPAVLTLPMAAGLTADQVGSMVVMGSKGVVPLASIATVAQTKEPVQVTHTDGQRTVTISATPSGSNLGQANTDIKTALTGLTMPAGSRWEIAGASQQMAEVFTSLGIAMLIAILLVYIIMVGTFRSIINPLILLVSIPFAAVGAVLLMVITGTPLGMPTLIGLLMLIGIVVTNAIVLMDLIEQFRDQGMDARTAVVEGARRRLRPILMTAVATILALTPMALGLGEGSFLSRPLALVVIGGLLSSTFLTLVLVPTVYLAVDRLRRGQRREQVG